MVSYELILDDFYICICTKGDGITLACKDSFCSGCMLKLIYKGKFAESHIMYCNEKSIDSFNENNNKYIWLTMKVKCPKCLIITEIGNLM